MTGSRTNSAQSPSGTSFSSFLPEAKDRDEPGQSSSDAGRSASALESPAFPSAGSTALTELPESQSEQGSAGVGRLSRRAPLLVRLRVEMVLEGRSPRTAGAGVPPAEGGGSREGARRGKGRRRPSGGRGAAGWTAGGAVGEGAAIAVGRAGPAGVAPARRAQKGWVVRGTRWMGWPED